MHVPRHNRLHAEANIADFDDAMELIHNVWTKVHREDCGFSEEQPLGEDAEQLRLPLIVYDLQHRKHSEHHKTGSKPKQFDVYPDPEQPGHNLTEVTEWFDCIVDFYVYGRAHGDAKMWTKNLENFFLGYTGHFKKSGVHEILFIEEGPNRVSTEYRQDLPHRRLRYLVRIQRTQIVRTIRLDEVDVKVVSPDASQPSGIREVYPDDEFMNHYAKTK